MSSLSPDSTLFLNSSINHRWNLSPKEAAAIQNRLKGFLHFSPINSAPKFIAGADISLPRFGRRAVAGVVVLSFPDLEKIEESLVEGEVTFPYVPGLLSFREGPLLEKAFERLKSKPDLVLFDGQGIAHPRGLGIASHMGLRLGLRTIGCAKSRLWGEAKQQEPGKKKGSWEPLLDSHGETIGAIVRTRSGVKPVYISQGHLVDLQGAIEFALATSPRFRIPEPIRAAHKRTNEERIRLGIF